MPADRLSTTRLVRAGTVAVIAAGVATGIGLALDLNSKPGAQVVYVVFAAIAASIAGFEAGLIAGLLSFPPFIYFFLNNPEEFAVRASEVVSLIVLAVGVVLVSWIVSRERSARALSAGARQVNDALTEAGTAIWEWDVDADRIRWSDDVRRMYGLERKAKLDSLEQLVDWIHSDDRAGFRSAVENALRDRGNFELEVRTTLSPAGWRWIQLQGNVHRRGARGTSVSGLTRDVTFRRRVEERERFLGEVTRRLAVGHEYDEILAELAQLVVPELGDFCAIDVASEDETIVNRAVVHADPAKVELVRELRRRFPLDPGGARGVPAVLTSGKPELYTEITDDLLVGAARNEDELALLRSLRLSTSMIVPLNARGRTLGAITITTADSVRRYDEEDLAFAEEVAQLGALMVDNARLHRDEQEARGRAEHAARRMERLQELTARLSAAATPDDVARNLVDESRDLLGARAAWVSVLSDDRRELRQLASSGYREDFVQKYRRIPVESNVAVAECVRIAEPVWLESVEQSGDDYPELAEGGTATGGNALAAVPLIGSEGAFGFLALRFEGPHEFTTVESARITSFVRQCAQSLERSQLYERESAARADAEVHRGELQFLSDVSKTLASTLEIDEMLDELLRLTVPRLADATSFFLLEDGHYLRRAASMNVDPARTKLMRELRGVRIDIHEDPEGPLARAVTHLEPVALPRLTPEALAALAVDERQLRTLESLGMRSWHAIPLVAHGEAIGVLSLATVGERAFSGRDLDLAQEFAGRAALALTNAYDFEREREARASAERASERLGHLHRITAALARAVTMEDVAQAIMREGGAAFGADSAAVHLLSPDGSSLEPAAVSGHLSELVERYGSISTAQEVPAMQAIRRAEVLWYASAAEVAEVYPDHAQVREGLEAVGFVPLIGREEPLGLLTVSFVEQRPVSDEDRALIDVLLAQCGQALERARLYEREQEARRNAEDAGRRLDQLQTILEVGLSARTVDELLTELLSHVRGLLQADRAAVLILDEDAQVLRVRASVGLAEEVRREVSVPLGHGIAGRIAATSRPMIVPDLKQADVVSTYLREAGGSLIGVPLVVEGRVLGVLHVSTLRTDAFDEDNLELLRLTGERVALAFERTMVYEREHEIAVTLQQSVLPGRLPELEHLGVAVRYLPGRNELEVGGDWYDVIELDETHVGIVVGDVVGKGVIAASAMAQLRNALRVYALEGFKPSSVLTRLGELARTVGTPFATVLYMVIDLERGTCRYSSAGHPPPLHFHQGWPAVYLEGGRSTPIGIGLDTRCRQATVELAPGDLILLYTDGLVESRSMTLSEGMDRLCEAVESGPEPLEELLDHLGESLAVETRQDDVALVAVRWVPAPSLNIRLASDPSSLAEFRSRLRLWLDGAGIGDEEANDILVACSEACANAILHAREPTAAEFEVTGTRRNGEISLVVRDFGRWRDPEPQRRGGFGLKLMDALMDDVEVDKQAEGTAVRMRRRITGTNGRVTAQGAPAEAGSAPDS